MHEKIEQFILWLGDFVEDSHSGRPSVKRFGLALAVTVLCGVMLGLGSVISYAMLMATGRDQVDIVRIAADTLQIIAGLVLAAVTTGYLVDKASNRKASTDESNRQNTQQPD
jgi:hypothetical protein